MCPFNMIFLSLLTILLGSVAGAKTSKGMQTNSDLRNVTSYLSDKIEENVKLAYEDSKEQVNVTNKFQGLDYAENHTTSHNSDKYSNISKFKFFNNSEADFIHGLPKDDRSTEIGYSEENQKDNTSREEVVALRQGIGLGMPALGSNGQLTVGGSLPGAWLDNSNLQETAGQIAGLLGVAGGTGFNGQLAGLLSGGAGSDSGSLYGSGTVGNGLLGEGREVGSAIPGQFDELLGIGASSTSSGGHLDGSVGGSSGTSGLSWNGGALDGGGSGSSSGQMGGSLGTGGLSWGSGAGAGNGQFGGDFGIGGAGTINRQPDGGSGISSGPMSGTVSSSGSLSGAFSGGGSGTNSESLGTSGLSWGSGTETNGGQLNGSLGTGGLSWGSGAGASNGQIGGGFGIGGAGTSNRQPDGGSGTSSRPMSGTVSSSGSLSGAFSGGGSGTNSGSLGTGGLSWGGGAGASNGQIGGGFGIGEAGTSNRQPGSGTSSRPMSGTVNSSGSLSAAFSGGGSGTNSGTDGISWNSGSGTYNGQLSGENGVGGGSTNPVSPGNAVTGGVVGLSSNLGTGLEVESLGTNVPSGVVSASIGLRPESTAAAGIQPVGALVSISTPTGYLNSATGYTTGSVGGGAAPAVIVGLRPGVTTNALVSGAYVYPTNAYVAANNLGWYGTSPVYRPYNRPYVSYPYYG